MHELEHTYSKMHGAKIKICASSLKGIGSYCLWCDILLLHKCF